jgi:hypothetical protein
MKTILRVKATKTAIAGAFPSAAHTEITKERKKK